MLEPRSPIRSRLARFAAVSVTLWLAILAAAWWYLARANARTAAATGLPITDADSIGLPLVALGVWLAIALLVLNAAVAAVLILRRERR